VPSVLTVHLRYDVPRLYSVGCSDRAAGSDAEHTSAAVLIEGNSDS
jgi:hypothetical protein